MSKEDLATQIKELSQSALARAEDCSGLLAVAKGFILEQFGPHGLLAVYVVTAVLALLCLMWLVRLGLAILRYLVLPAVVLAVLGSLLLPYSFSSLLPFTVTGCSLWLLAKA